MIDTSELSNDESICHFGAVKYRVTGSGNLVSTFQSLDTVQTTQLATIAMQATPGREPTILTNFISQRAFLRVETMNLNETFRINRIVVYAKPLWTQFYGS
jgi:hypothetical protein